MNLIIFDIDGTLTETVKADDECYVRSLAEVFGFNDVDGDWSNYRHTTDAGILQEIFEVQLGRLPLEKDVAQFRNHFVGLLAQAAAAVAFQPVAGASRLLADLRRSEQHHVSLATGAWSDSARLKMASAGLNFDDYPAASSDDAADRESIIRLSMQRATDRYGRMATAIYVGDGVWDARACRRLRIPFIGIASGARARLLTHEGAVRVFHDLSDDRAFMNVVERAPADLGGRTRAPSAQ